MNYRIHVDGDPIPKGRPRLGAGGNVYTPARTKDFEHEIGWAWKVAGHPLIHQEVRVEIIVWESKHPADLDNYIKSCLDALNEIAWPDDKQVVHIKATVFRHCDSPGVAIDVQPILSRKVP